MSQHDPVEEFFSRERRDVPDLPGGPEHWERLVTESRRPARRAWLPYLGAAAAAAVVVGAVAYGTTSDGTDHPSPATASRGLTATVTRTVTAPPTTTGASPTPTSSAPSATTAPTTGTQGGPLPAPVSFEAVSMSNAGGGRLYALGSARCGTQHPQCVAVVGSDDDGATWTTRASFTDFVAPGARHTPDKGNQLIGVRFAKGQVGYVYGSVVKRTTDGGRHWSDFDIGGRRVLSLETDGSTVWFVTASSCRHAEPVDQRGCSGVSVWSAPVDATRASKVRDLGVDHPVEGAWLSLDGSDAYVSVSYADSSLQTLPQRVSGTPATLPRPQGCATTGGTWVWGTARADGHLVAVCTSTTDNGQRYAVSSSSDRGATWSPAAPAPALGKPGYTGVWLTAADPRDLVAVAQGLPTSSSRPEQPTTLLSSADGGRSWAAPRGASASGSWSWAGAAGGRLVYVLGGGSGSFEVSTDSGASFVPRSFRR